MERLSCSCQTTLVVRVSKQSMFFVVSHVHACTCIYVKLKMEANVLYITLWRKSGHLKQKKEASTRKTIYEYPLRKNKHSIMIQDEKGEKGA